MNLCLFERREREQAEIQSLKAERAHLEKELGQLTDCSRMKFFMIK